MPSYSDERLDRLELALRLMEERSRRAEDKLAQLDQRQRMQAAGVGQGAASGRPNRRIARATSAVTAGSASGPGSGSVQPIRYDGSSWVDVGAPFGLWNAGAAISSGKRCTYWMDDDGAFWVEPEECE